MARGCHGPLIEPEHGNDSPCERRMQPKRTLTRTERAVAYSPNVHIGTESVSKRRILSGKRDSASGMIDSNHAEAVFVGETLRCRDVGTICAVHAFELLV
jgi:hypothetical protein